MNYFPCFSKKNGRILDRKLPENEKYEKKVIVHLSILPKDWFSAEAVSLIAKTRNVENN